MVESNKLKLSALGYASLIITYFNLYEEQYTPLGIVLLVVFGLIYHVVVQCYNKYGQNIPDVIKANISKYFDVVICILAIFLVDKSFNSGIKSDLSRMVSGDTASMIAVYSLTVLVMILFLSVSGGRDFLDRVGSNFFLIVILQPLLVLLNGLWENSNIFSQGAVRIIILLSIANILGYFLRKIIKIDIFKQIFCYDVNLKSNIFLTALAIVWFMLTLRLTYTIGDR